MKLDAGESDSDPPSGKDGAKLVALYIGTLKFPGRNEATSFGTVLSESPIGLSRRSPTLAVKMLGSTSHPIM